MFLVLLFAFLIHPLSLALQLNRTYENGPINLTSAATLYFQVDKNLNIARFALVLNDTSVIENGPFWMGIGIGEPTSGSMLGADVLTAEMETGALDSCKITDRYVPFVAYPLTEAPGPFPLPDECEEPDWTLISCRRDPNGSAILEIERPLTVMDEKQDRPILAGESSVLYAYGGAFGYHGGNRYSSKVVLYTENDTMPSGAALPADIDGSFELRATNYTVPINRTTYACTSLALPIPSSGKRMIVAIEPLINIPMIHHFTLYICSGSEYARQTMKTVACGGVEPFGPVGNDNAGCSTFVFGCTCRACLYSIPTPVYILLY